MIDHLTATAWWVPSVVLGLALLVLWAPAVARNALGADGAMLGALSLALVVAAFAPSGLVAYGALATAAGAQAWQAARAGARVASRSLAVAAILLAVAGGTHQAGAMVVAFVASTLAIALRAGTVPVHAGVAELCDRAAHRQTEQLAVTVLLVFVQLRLVGATPFAFDAAPSIVRYGAAMTLLPGLLALVQSDLRGFYRAATLMHGGMILAALGAAGHGHAAAALMVVVTTAVALGGLGIAIDAFEARVGAAAIGPAGGRVHALPRLAAVFAFFGAAGVAMPGTAGFIADDLMLHALWEESVVATVMIILGSATLAVATLRAYASLFLGPAVPTVAPDLLARERAVVTTLLVLLLLLGIVPGYLLTPADVLLRPMELP